MTDPRKLKKEKLNVEPALHNVESDPSNVVRDFSNVEPDAHVHLTVERVNSPKAEKLEEKLLEPSISNTEKWHDGFLDIQGED